MFTNSSILVICADDSSVIKRVEVDAGTQTQICTAFSEAVQDLTDEKSKVEFDGKYKPEKDEILFINNFQLSDEIKDAVRNPMGVSPYEKENGEYSPIKAIFVGEKTEDRDSEEFIVAFQRFRKEQYLSTSNFNLFWSKDTFRCEKEYGISISDTIDCYFFNDELQFRSFYYARQVFDLSGYYRSATTQEVTAFTSNKCLSFDNASDFEAMANSSIRRKIAAINDSEVLEKYKAIEIKKLAQKAGINIAVKEEKIVIPNDKEQIKLILGFLDEEAYKGPFSQITFLANSKRKVKNK
ncbi:MAG: DUF4868 domain-containing protein [Peptococcaceae bacterium]|nr:DUF4868 domain-containing protein [Peptococcaceae bacterium]